MDVIPVMPGQDRENEAREVGIPGGGLYLSWETQRRTTTLAAKLGVPLFRIVSSAPRWRRYLVQIPATMKIIVRRRPAWLVVQNPSIVLAAIACILRRPLGFRLIVDRHTNFMLAKPAGLKKTLFTVLSNLTLRHADLTIVTNPFLAKLVADCGGRPFVLQDPLPDLEIGDHPAGAKHNNEEFGLFVCTFAADEPYGEVIRAAGVLQPGQRLYVSGRPPRNGLAPDLERAVSQNPQLTLTGFIPDAEYASLMAGSAFVMVLTRAQHCLVCGAYEAIALGRPLLLSNREALREYFGSEVPRYVGDDEADIARALSAAFAGDVATPAAREQLRAQLNRDWNGRFRTLACEIRALVA